MSSPAQGPEYVVVDSDGNALYYAVTPHCPYKILKKDPKGGYSQFVNRDGAIKAAEMTQKFYMNLSKENSETLKEFPEYHGMADWALMTVENYFDKKSNK